MNSVSIITNVAGNGVAAFGGDGGLAVASTTTLNNPQSVFVTSGGDIYISDLLNNVIRKVFFADFKILMVTNDSFR